MEVKVKAIHFDASEKLHSFIEKKVAKIAKQAEKATLIEITLKVVKPETNKNKETAIKLFYAGGSLFADKVCDTFEEGVDLCIEAIQRQLEKQKNKV